MNKYESFTILSKPDIKKDIRLYHETQKRLKDIEEARKRDLIHDPSPVEVPSRFGRHKNIYVTR